MDQHKKIKPLFSQACETLDTKISELNAAVEQMDADARKIDPTAYWCKLRQTDIIERLEDQNKTV